MPEIQNPNQQPGGLDGKSMLSMMLLFVMVFAGLTWYRQHNSNAAEPSPVQNSQAQTAPASTPAGNGNFWRGGEVLRTGTVAKPEATGIQALAEQTTTVENELYSITFTNRGARVQSWILKRYTDDNGKPLDLVNVAAAKQAGYPLSLYTYDAGLRTRIADALFVPSGAAGKISTASLNAPTEITFDYAANGLTVHKAFRFDQSYVIHASASVTQNGAPVQAMLAWPSALGRRCYAGAVQLQPD